MMKPRGIKGTTYTLGENPVGSGGEGNVYHAYVTNMVKVYKPGVMTRELENKLRVMVEHPPNESVLTQVAWPLDVLCDNNAKCIGFTMPELSINAELGDVYPGFDT